MPIHQNMKSENSLLICPECKNTVNLSRYPNLAQGMVIECDHCGMTLLVKDITDSGEIKTDIVDEGK
jgi:DNA-directed RNA polymerase subunit RPC12/RpoP